MTSPDRPADVVKNLDGLAPLFGALDAIRVKQAELAEHERTLVEKIKAELGSDGTVGTVAGQTRVTWREYPRTSIDTKALRADYPEIAEKCEKTTAVRRFQIVDGGGK